MGANEKILTTVIPQIKYYFLQKNDSTMSLLCYATVSLILGYRSSEVPFYFLFATCFVFNDEQELTFIQPSPKHVH